MPISENMVQEIVQEVMAKMEKRSLPAFAKKLKKMQKYWPAWV